MKRIQGIIKDDMAPSNKGMLWLKPNKEQRTATFYYYGVNGWTPIDANLDINSTVDGNTTDIEELFKIAVTNAAYNEEDSTIEFYNKSGDLLCSIDVSNFLENGLIEDVTLSTEDDTTYLVITFKTTTGTSDVKVDISTLIDVYTAGDGIDITGNTVSIKIDPDSDEYLSVGENGLLLIGVKDAIDGINNSVETINSSIETINSTLDTKSTVTFEQSQTEGNLIGVLTIDGTVYNIYSPVTDLSDYYTSEQVNELINNLSLGDSVSYVASTTSGTLIGTLTIEETAYELYAPTVDLSDYYTKNEITTIIADYYTKTEVDSLFESYYTKTEIDATIANYYTSAQIDSMLESYYTKTEIDETIAAYYTKTEIDSMLTKYYTMLEVDAKIADLESAIDEKSTVSYTASVTSGTVIGTLTIDGTIYNLYSPEVDLSDYVTTIALNTAVQEMTDALSAAVTELNESIATKSTVVFSQTLTEGTEIGVITIDGTSHSIYAPETDLSVSVANYTGTSLVTIRIDGTSYTIKSPYITYNNRVGTTGTLLGYFLVQTQSTETGTVSTTSVPIYAPDVDLSGYYTSEQIDEIIANLSLGDKVSYTASVTEGTLIGTLTIEDTVYEIYSPTVDLSDYYTKTEIDDTLSTYLSRITNLETTVATKSTVIVAPTQTSGNVVGYITVDGTRYTLYSADTDLSDYYTKTEIDSLLSETSAVSYSPTLTSGTEIGVLTINGVEYTLYSQVDSTTYYNKQEIDQLITSNITEVQQNVQVEWVEID